MAANIFLKISTGEKTGPTTSDPLTLYFTTGQYRYRDADPSTEASPVEWSPVIEQGPTISQSNTEFVTSNLSISGTSVTLINNGDLNNLIDGSVTWYNSVAEVWFELDGAYTKVFTGIVNRATVQDRTIQLSLKSNIEKLKQPAYFGDTRSECVITSGTYPNAPVENLGRPIPMMFGPFFPETYIDSPFIYLSGNEKRAQNKILSYGGGSGQLVDGVSNIHVLGRLYSTPSTTSINLTVTQVTSGGTYTNLRAITASSFDSIKIGERVTVRFTNGATADGYVFFIDYVNKFARIINEDIVTNPTPTNFPNFQIDRIVSRSSAQFSLNIRSDDDTYGDFNNQRSDIIFSRTGSFTATSGGNVRFTGAYTDKFGALDTPSPGVYGNNVSHELTLNQLFINTGLTLDKQNMTEVNSVSTLAAYPHQTTNPIPSVLEVLEDLTTGLGVLVGVKSDGSILYKPLSNSLTATAEITETEMIRSSLSIDEEYRDLAYSIQLTNKVAAVLQAPSSALGEITNTAVLNLYDVDRAIKVVHPHLSITTFQDRLEAITSQPKRLYRLKVPLEYLGLEIGDEVDLVLPSFGIDETCYVVGYQKSNISIQLTLLKPYSF